MKNIYSVDQKILNYKIEDIFNIIQDFSTYTEWFPKKFKLEIISLTNDLIGSKLKISYLGLTIYWEIIKIDNLKEILISYSGDLKGLGVWYFTDYATGVKIMFEIEVKIVNPLIYLGSFFINPVTFHSNKMKQIFDSLDNYLAIKYPDEKISLNNNGNIQPPTFTLPGNRFGT